MSEPTTHLGQNPLNDAQWCLSQILGSLPQRRDWLDPDLEKMARGIVLQPQEPDEPATLRAVVSACMKAMPCGNITTHTPENLAGRISDLAQSLATESLENATLRAERELMLVAIREAASSFQYIQNHSRDEEAPWNFYWNAMNQSRAALSKLAPYLNQGPPLPKGYIHPSHKTDEFDGDRRGLLYSDEDE